MIITQLYDMLSESTQGKFYEIFSSLAQGGSSVMKKKICQNLHETKFVSDEDLIVMLEQFIKDSNE